jgi:hypothetical protein
LTTFKSTRMCHLSSQWALLIVPLLSVTAHGGEPTYWQEIRPVIRKHCTVCHSVRNLREPDISGGLALDSFEALIRSGKKTILVPGKSGDSLLLHVLETKDSEKRMPLGVDPLPAETITLLRRWVDAGAPEGKRVDVETTPVATLSRRRLKKLDVTLTTTTTPPAGTFGPGPTGPLRLMLAAGPLAPVDAVAFSPDGQRLATGSYGRVTVWNVTSGTVEQTLTGVLGAVNDVRFSPDGKTLAVAGGQPSAKGDLRLFDTATWKVIAVLAGHHDVVSSVAFSRDGKHLASASFDKTVRIWNLETLKSEHELTGHSDFVYAVAYSPDGKWIASASKDRSVKVVDSVSGASRFTFSGMDQDVMAVAISPNGEHIVSAGFEPALHWWNSKTGQRTRLQGGHGVAVNELCFSNDGKLVASAGSDSTVRLWDANGSPIKTVPTTSLVYAVAISPDSHTVVAGCFDGLVRVYDTRSGQHLVSLLTLNASDKDAQWLAMTPQGYSSSKGINAVARWQIGNRSIAADAVWSVLQRPDAIARSLHGEAVAVPTFKK